MSPLTPIPPCPPIQQAPPSPTPLLPLHLRLLPWARPPASLAQSLPVTSQHSLAKAGPWGEETLEVGPDLFLISYKSSSHCKRRRAVGTVGFCRMLAPRVYEDSYYLCNFSCLNLKSCPNQKFMKKKKTRPSSVKKMGKGRKSLLLAGGRTVVGFNAQSRHHATLSFFPFGAWSPLCSPRAPRSK